MRSYTVLPLAMPRATTAPVQFEGHTIPEGTMVFLNAWACNRGEISFFFFFLFLLIIILILFQENVQLSERFIIYHHRRTNICFLCPADPDAFNRPWEFHPERWLGDSDKHTHQFAFGYGARMCVASHLASSLVYTVLLHLLAHFEVRPAAQDTDATIDPVKGLADPTALTLFPRSSRARFILRRGKLQNIRD